MFYHVFFLLFLITDLYFLISPAMGQILFNPIPELVLSREIPRKEAEV